jgi:hypothetical protein
MIHVLYNESVPNSKIFESYLDTVALIVIILVAVAVFIQPSCIEMLVSFEVTAAVLVLMLFV